MPPHLIWGEILFRSPYILHPDLARRGISCDGCHPQGAASDHTKFPGSSKIPGVVDLSHKSLFAAAENGRTDGLRIPSLRGLRYLAPYGIDGRTASLRDFTRDIVETTFGGAKLSERDLHSLVAYLRELDFLPNPKLTPTGNLAPAANESGLAGEKVFHQIGCVRCHNPQSYFTDGRIWRVNGVETSSPYSMENGLKTPTLMRAARQRYLHDGSATFESVLQKHSAQLGIKVDPVQIPALQSYLREVMFEEKPFDGRHLTERAAELNSWLRLVPTNFPLYRVDIYILLKTLRHNFEALRSEFRTEPDKKIYRDYISGIEHFIAICQKTPRQELEGQIQEFERVSLEKLRFVGTSRK
jgi:hypothetical protein